MVVKQHPEAINNKGTLGEVAEGTWACRKAPADGDRADLQGGRELKSWLVIALSNSIPEEVAVTPVST